MSKNNLSTSHKRKCKKKKKSGLSHTLKNKTNSFQEIKNRT